MKNKQKTTWGIVNFEAFRWIILLGMCKLLIYEEGAKIVR